MALDKKIIDFLSPQDVSLFVYIHRTSSKVLAKKIMKEGFEFYESLHNTTDIIINDPIHIQYWIKMREYYGNYTMVICIKKSIFYKYLNFIKSSIDYSKIHIEVEQLLTEKAPYNNENDDKIFTLSNHYVKGYFNNITNETVYNPEFNPEFDSPIFVQNYINLVKNT